MEKRKIRITTQGGGVRFPLGWVLRGGYAPSSEKNLLQFFAENFAFLRLLPEHSAS